MKRRKRGYIFYDVTLAAVVVAFCLISAVNALAAFMLAVGFALGLLACHSITSE